MSLKARLARLEGALAPELKQVFFIREVSYFEPGPDGDPNGPVCIIVRDPEGNQRILSSLRDFYDATVIDPSREPPRTPEVEALIREAREGPRLAS